MTTKRLKIIKARRLRLTRLDMCGNPMWGSCGTVITGGMSKLAFTPNVESGTEYTSKNGFGEFEINEKDPDFWKWHDVTLTMTYVDPAVSELVAAGTPAVYGDDVIGVAFDGEQNLGAFAIEMWSKRVGSACDAAGNPTWGYTLLPFCKNGTVSGERSHEDGTMSMELTAQAFRSPSWGTGPYAENPYMVPFPANHMDGLVETTVQPPADTDGCVALIQPPDKAAVEPGDVFMAESTVTAQDSTNAAKLSGLGYVPATTTVWLSGEFFTVGSFQFHWSGTAWVAGAKT